MTSSNTPQATSETASRPDRIRVERVTFASSDESLVGDLYLPAAASDGPRPAVVVTGAWGTVKEQMAAGYAREMSARGFIALAFDFRGWGQSGGRRRSMEDPFAKAADIVAAADFLATRSDVDPDAIVGLGICASAAYLATAATRTARITSLALVAPALPSRETVVETLGGQQAAEALLDMAQAAEAEYERTGHERLVPCVPESADAPAPGADYYTNPNRGMIPEWDNTFNLASWTRWLEYDAQAAVDGLRQPLFVMHSDAAASPESVREFVAKVPGRVDQIWLDDVSQFDFYDQPGLVKVASDAAARHFLSTTR